VKSPPKKETAKKQAATKEQAGTKKAAPAGRPTVKQTPRRATSKAAARRPRKVAVTAATARSLPVLEEESAWTSGELAEVKEELESDVRRLESEIDLAEVGLAGLMQDAGDQSGDDEADAGAKTFEREQEISLANNSRDMLEQSLHALERIAAGTYGGCESCGNPVGKLRLQAFPRATLCMTCKRKQERR
jgi:RNA polymerase-binding transcription factor DksA